TLNEIIQDAGNCLREARRSVAGLRGETAGLATALAETARQLTETHDVHLKLRVQGAGRRFAADVEYQLLRVAQEAITNAVKPSGARNIVVAMAETPRALRLSVEDDGRGFDEGAGSNGAAGHYGLTGMRERARQIGAELSVDSVPGRGTAVRLVLPIAASGIP